MCFPQGEELVRQGLSRMIPELLGCYKNVEETSK
jgi:hypothetical protein